MYVTSIGTVLHDLPSPCDYSATCTFHVPVTTLYFWSPKIIPLTNYITFSITIIVSVTKPCMYTWIYCSPFVNYMTVPMYSHVQYQTTLLPSWITWLYPCTAMFNTRLPSSLHESHDYTHVYCTAMWEHPTWMESHVSSIMWLYPKHTPKLFPNWTLNELYIHTSVKCRPI